jgi:O-antigen biosynthesis protein
VTLRAWWQRVRRGRARPQQPDALPGAATFHVVTATPDRWPESSRVACAPSAAGARGEIVVLHAPSIVPAPDALHHVADALQRRPRADFVFGDETCAGSGHWHKPGWSPALLLAQPYVASVFAVRRELLGGEVAAAHDDDAMRYALALRMTAAARAVVHVPRVLGHDAAPVRPSAQHAVAAAAAARAAGLTATVTPHPDAAVLRVSVRPRERQAITVIVPTRDRLDLLHPCIDSVLATTGAHDVRVLIVDNGSAEPATLAQLARWRADARVQVLRDDGPFDYSALMNRAVAAARTPLVLLLNNDTKVVTADWLDQLAGWLDLPDVGAVGAKLYFADDTVQHAGVLLGVGGVASHGHKNLPRSSPGYHGLLHSVRDVSAVTGACLLTRRDLYLAVGGMEPALRVAYNDVDFCLRLRARGQRVIWTPLAELYHFEGKSRGKDKRGHTRFEHEIAFVQQRWGELIANDPFYNPNLTKRHVDYRAG